MSRHPPDRTIDTLLDLDGLVLVIDPAGKHWVKFTARRVPLSSARPHGIAYSLTLHDEEGNRLVGFDNAHAVAATRGPARRSRRKYDQRSSLICGMK